MLNLTGASGNNLDQVSLSIPCGLFTCVTGVSGSGKSTLINHTLYPLAATELNKATTLKAQPYEAIDGLQHLDKVVDIDQSPIGRTPRAPIPQRIRVCLRRFESCLPKFPKLEPEVTNPDDSALTLKVAAVSRAKATV